MIILSRCCATEDIKNNFGKITKSMFDKNDEDNDDEWILYSLIHENKSSKTSFSFILP